MNEADVAEWEFPTLGLKVRHLARDETQAPGRFGRLGKKLAERIPLCGLHGGKKTEGPCQESITGKYRHSLSKNLVRGGLPPAQIIVIHAGEIIMDQRVGVDEFHGAGTRKDRRGILGAAGLRGGECQDRAKPLAPGKEAVAHRPMNNRGARCGGRNGAPERRLHQLSTRFQINGKAVGSFCADSLPGDHKDREKFPRVARTQRVLQNSSRRSSPGLMTSRPVA